MDSLPISRLLKFSTLLKNVMRQNSVRTASRIFDDNNETIKQNSDHIYKRRLTESEIITYIADHIVYKTKDFIATSKPYGVGKSKPSKLIKQYIPQALDNFYLDEILPKVAKKLDYKMLKLVKGPERFASGIMILATTEDGTSKILRSIQLAKNRECTIHSYIAVTVGHLPVKKHETKFAMKIVKEGDGDISTVLEKWSKNAVKQNKVKTVIWEHEVISESKLASLVKVNISNTHKNSLKLYLATKCFSPVLGDQIFGSRVANVFGVNLPVHPSNNVKATETINPELLSCLQIQENELKIIPCHVHLQSVTLPIQNKLDLTLSVPPPETFRWTCDHLNLKI